MALEPPMTAGTGTRTLDSVVVETPAPAHHVHRLKPNAVGLWGVAFMAVATAAPITAMAGVVPISVGFGLGTYTPAGYIIATVVLALFGVGYVAMARHITCTGAFYGYVSYGLGQIVGMGAGLLATLAYIIFEAAIVGGFAYFGTVTFSLLFGLHVHWLVFALIALGLNALMSYFEVKLATQVLSVLLITELSILMVGAVVTAIHGGGPFTSDHHSVTWSALNPVGAFSHAPALGLGIFLAFWSWVGFESTAIYGEESRNPRRIIPRATMLVIFGVGAFYTFVSLMVVSANGPKAVAVGSSSNPLDLFFGPMRAYLGHWSIDMFTVLMMTGSYACCLAFHNCAARYLYALGRERTLAGFHPLGRTHPKHQSAHIAGFVQSVVATVLVLLFFVAGSDPYIDLFGLFGILGTMAILTAQALCCFATVGYFARNRHLDKNMFRTVVAPLLAGVALLYILMLLFKNQKTAAGPAAGSLLFSAIPWIVYGVFALGIGGAVYLKYRSPETYRRIGRVVLEDVTVRE
jgi:amino acid transporter